MKSQVQKDEDDNTKGMITTVRNNTEPVPLDLLIEILTRLPAKSVLKFRCVSKQWCSITESRSFINSFMSLSPPRLSISYSIRHPGNENMLFYFSSSSRHQESNHLSSISTCTYRGITSSVRGINLICIDHTYFAIFNPTTRQVIRVPNCSKSDTFYYINHVVLGYNPSNDQYKILRRTSIPERSMEHSVCTLEKSKQSSFSSWRHVENDVLYYLRDWDAVCINGVVYYGVVIDTPRAFAVMSFDVGSERLSLIQGPNEGDLGKYNSLVNYHGKIACCSVDFGSKRFELSVLDDAKEQIWSTKTFAPPPCFYDSHHSLGPSICRTTDAGEIVFVSKVNNDDVEIVYYDVKKNNVRRRAFRLGGFPPHHDGFNCSFSFWRFYFSCDHVDNITLF